MGYGTLTDLAKAVLAVAILVVMLETIGRVIDEVLSKIRFGPDRLEKVGKYLVLTGIATFICREGHFDFFQQLMFSWNHRWHGYLLTGALIAGGTPMLMRQFKMWNLIPNVVTGMASMFGWGSYGQTNTEDAQETTPGNNITPV